MQILALSNILLLLKWIFPIIFFVGCCCFVCYSLCSIVSICSIVVTVIAILTTFNATHSAADTINLFGKYLYVNYNRSVIVRFAYFSIHRNAPPFCCLLKMNIELWEFLLMLRYFLLFTRCIIHMRLKHCGNFSLFGRCALSCYA